MNGRPGMLWFMRSQTVGHSWATVELNWTKDTARPAHWTKDWLELAGCGPAHPPQETGRQGQPEPEQGNCGPREASSTKLQAGFVANQDFLGFWTVNSRLRLCASCTPRKPSDRDGGGNKSQQPRSPSTWSSELLRPGKGTKRRPDRVCTFEEYPSTWTWAAQTWEVHTTQGRPQTFPSRAT